MNSCLGVIIGLVVLLLVAVVIAFALSFTGMKKAGFRQNCSTLPCDYGLICSNNICLREQKQSCLLDADCSSGNCINNRCAQTGVFLEKVTPVPPLGSTPAGYNPYLPPTGTSIPVAPDPRGLNEPCTNNGECSKPSYAGGLICSNEDIGPKVCRFGEGQPCRVGTDDCGRGLNCDAGVCRRMAGGGGHQGDPCIKTSQCAVGFACMDNVCLELKDKGAVLGEACNVNSDCSGDYVCKGIQELTAELEVSLARSGSPHRHHSPSYRRRSRERDAHTHRDRGHLSEHDHVRILQSGGRGFEGLGQGFEGRGRRGVNGFEARNERGGGFEDRGGRGFNGFEGRGGRGFRGFEERDIHGGHSEEEHGRHKRRHRSPTRHHSPPRHYSPSRPSLQTLLAEKNGFFLEKALLQRNNGFKGICVPPVNPLLLGTALAERNGGNGGGHHGGDHNGFHERDDHTHGDREHLNEHEHLRIGIEPEVIVRQVHEAGDVLAPCEHNGQCLDNLACVDHKCRIRDGGKCHHGNQCTSGNCDHGGEHNRGHCVARRGCRDDSGCPQGTYCGPDPLRLGADNICIVNPGDGGIGAHCTNNGDCHDGLHCERGHCEKNLQAIPRPVVRECLRDEDCINHGLGFECVNEFCLRPCGSSSDCLTGKTCVANFCREVGMAGTLNAPCRTGIVNPCDPGLRCDTKSTLCKQEDGHGPCKIKSDCADPDAYCLPTKDGECPFNICTKRPLNIAANLFLQKDRIEAVARGFKRPCDDMYP